MKSEFHSPKNLPLIDSPVSLVSSELTMNKRTLRSAQNNNKGVHGRSNLNDFISQMPDDILVKILSLLCITDAGVTSCLSKRWRFLWCYLTRLNFDGTETLEKMANDHKLSVSEREKFVNQVYNVIASHKNPSVRVFQMCFDLDESYYHDIDFWLRFALDKKVEMIDLNLMDKNFDVRENPAKNYDFPLPSLNGNMIHLVEWPSVNDMVVEMRSLKKVSLMGVNISGPNLLGLLKRSPCLETLYIYGSGLSTDIHVGGRDINLKHFTIVSCSEVESIFFYDFDLVSFLYNGPEINLHLTGLPMLKKLNFCETTGAGLNNNVLAQISSVASNLQVLCLDIGSPKDSYNVNSIPKLPNVKKLVLLIGAEEDDSLLELTSIAKVCPRLVKFEIELLWSSPIKRRKKVKHAAPHPHEHLKLFKIGGYYGRISDFELAVYVIDNAVALRKITIDPSCVAYISYMVTDEELSKREKAARSSAERQIRPILPRGVELVIV